MPAPVLHLAAAVYAPGAVHPMHEHDALHLSVLLSGEVDERVGRETERGRALSVVIKDPAVRHADRFGATGATLARLSLARTGLGDLVEQPGRAPHWGWRHDVRVAAPFLRLACRAADGERDFRADDDDVVDLLAALTARPAGPSRGQPPGWLRTARAQLTDAWHPAIRVRDVAHAAGVHPVYLARCVRRWYGIGAAEQLRRTRLMRAAAAVTTSRGTLSSVAHQCGFADEAHLCREFGRATGITPGRFRRLHGWMGTAPSTEGAN